MSMEAKYRFGWWWGLIAMVEQFKPENVEIKQDNIPALPQFEFADPDQLKAVLIRRRPAIAATLEYLRDK